MNKEQKIIKLKKMLHNCPEMLTPIKAYKWSPLGRNKIYKLIQQKELRAFTHQGSYIILKEDLIEYLAEHSDDKSHKFHRKKER